MYRKYFFSDGKVWIIICTCLVAAYIGGGVYCGLLNGTKCDEMLSFLTDFLNGCGRIDRKSVFMGSLRDMGVLFGLIFVSGFFKAGVTINVATVMRKGFVAGFTSAAFFKIFGMRGIFGVGALLSELLIMMIALSAFSVCSVKMSLKSAENKRNYLIFFALFGIVFGAVFCGLALCSGFLTTIFMKGAAGQIL